MDGIVNINKPCGFSSHKIVNTLKKISGSCKAGHAGTLDVEAEGVLIVLLNEACKIFDLFLTGHKTYMATIELGSSSTTWDSAGQITKTKDIQFNFDTIKKSIETFTGTYLHRVPEYSAKKFEGKTFYSMKRKGMTIPERIQKTTIKEIKIIDYIHPRITFTVTCTSGTYVRTLAVDIAEKLGTTGYLAELVRTNVNGFSIENSVNPVKEEWENGFVDINEVMLKFPHVTIDSKCTDSIGNGIPFKECDILKISGNIDSVRFGVYSSDYKLLALADRINDEYKLSRVFNIESY